MAKGIKYFPRLTSDGPKTTVLENYATNNDFSNPSKNLLAMPFVCFHVVTPWQLSSQGTVAQYYFFITEPHKNALYY